ncbi:hypothetical protein MLC59_05820 [Marinobacter bryozoorum]|jgi:hypothetical protein|uniref:hypothetical protein n=1 Tax=Marinobacter bryozoorum TaxID=256324 RepID=UPI0020059353|nr:hypothetical protein [Marinobacter bryozoorum]MCK7543683.1 hypothetical protein [Marinobacter bryozoorum]
MTYFLGFCFVVIWLNLGILSYKASHGSVLPLETLPLPFRLVALLFAPIGLLVYERHLFFDKAKPDSLFPGDDPLP